MPAASGELVLEPVRILLRPPTDWPTLGHEIVEWIEEYLPHGPGDVEGDPLELDDEQAQWICDLYRLFPEDHERAGRRVVHEGVISRLKGRAKSELAGAIVVAEALGPVRFDGWDAHRDPVGVSVRRPFVRCLATEEEQSGNTYDNVTYMLDAAAQGAPDVFGGIDIGRDVQTSTRIYLPGGGEIRPSTASAASKDGGKETFAVADEPHLYTLPSLRAMYATVRRNTGKRRGADPWMLSTTTAFAPGERSVAEAFSTQAVKQLELEKKGRRRDLGFFYDHREAPPFAEPDDWNDDREVRARLIAAGATEWYDLDRLVETEFRGPTVDRSETARYWLNQVSQAAASAFDVDHWRKPVADGGLFLEGFEIPPGEKITLGFDGARFHDASALVATHLETGFQAPIGVWEVPANAPDDYEIDVDAVDAAATEAFELYDVVRLYADPPYWEEILDRWIARWGEKRVVKWWTNRDRQMAFAVSAYVTAQRAGDVSHGGDADLERHIGNTRRRSTRVKDENGRLLFTMRKEHPDSPNKIDAAMAACLSWEARGDAIAAGALKAKRKPRGHTF